MDELLKTRDALLADAEALIDSGDTDGAQAKMDEVTALDGKIDAMRKARKNLEALRDAPPPADISAQSVPAGGLKSEGEPVGLNCETVTAVNEAPEASNEYLTAWCKHAQGAALTSFDRDVLHRVNDSVLTTESHGILIPQTVTRGIWDDVSQSFPFWGDVTKTSVKGTMSIIKGDESTEAAWYDEPTPIAEGNETFNSLELSGCELARDISISWKLKEMAIAEFLPYIRRKLSEKAGAALGYGVMCGKGKPGNGDTFKPEPLGVLTALKAESGTPRIIKNTTGADGDILDDIITIRALIESKYAKGACYYMNDATLWGRIAKIYDANGRPIFLPDANNSGSVGRLFGAQIKTDDSVPTDTILFGNPKCYHANINKALTLDMEDHKKQRVTDYIIYAIVDGTPVTDKGFAAIEIKEP